MNNEQVINIKIRGRRNRGGGAGGNPPLPQSGRNSSNLIIQKTLNCCLPNAPPPLISYGTDISRVARPYTLGQTSRFSREKKSFWNFFCQNIGDCIVSFNFKVSRRQSLCKGYFFEISYIFDFLVRPTKNCTTYMHFMEIQASYENTCILWNIPVFIRAGPVLHCC